MPKPQLSMKGRHASLSRLLYSVLPPILFSNIHELSPSPVLSLCPNVVFSVRLSLTILFKTVTRLSPFLYLGCFYPYYTPGITYTHLPCYTHTRMQAPWRQVSVSCSHCVMPGAQKYCLGESKHSINICWMKVFILRAIISH